MFFVIDVVIVMLWDLEYEEKYLYCFLVIF